MHEETENNMTVIRSPRVNRQGRVLSVPEMSETSDATTEQAKKVSVKTSIDEKRRDLKNYQAMDLFDIDADKSDPKVDAEIHRLQRELESANIELDRLKESIADDRAQARDAGLVQGMEEARQKYEQDFQSKLKNFKELIANLEKTIKDELIDSEEQIVEVIVTALLRVFGQVLLSKQGIVEVVRNTVAQVQSENPLKIRVSHQDYQLISSSFEKEQEKSELEYKVMTDKNVQTGGCIVETQNGILDGRIETQLQSMLTALLAAKSKVYRDE